MTATRFVWVVPRDVPQPVRLTQVCSARVPSLWLLSPRKHGCSTASCSEVTRAASICPTLTTVPAGQQFSNYYFREYSLRRTREDFRANRSLTDPKRITELLDYGRRNLAVVKRQALIGKLYGHQDMVVEAAKRNAPRRK